MLLLMDCNTDEAEGEKIAVGFYTPLETNSIENWVEVRLSAFTGFEGRDRKIEIKRISMALDLQCSAASNNRQPKWILI